MEKMVPSHSWTKTKTLSRTYKTNSHPMTGSQEWTTTVTSPPTRDPTPPMRRLQECHQRNKFMTPPLTNPTLTPR
eukprot:15348305-Ditylum_brightwellii.AAC.1